MLRVRTEPWPRSEFLAYLDAAKKVAGIPNDAELARRAEVRSSVISRWRSGEQQPGHDNLRKVASALGVPTVNLWVAAGLVGPGDLDLVGQIDLKVLPAEFRDLIDLYDTAELNDEERQLLRTQARGAVLAVRAMLHDRMQTEQPTGRRRSA